MTRRTGMIVMISGSRFGMTNAQHLALQGLLRQLQPTVFHHGSCRGVDAEAHHLVKQVCPDVVRHAHPGETGQWRAYLHDADVTHEVKPPLERNREMVRLSSVVICCPYQAVEQLTGGTWSTWRWAVKQGKRTFLIRPDGKIEEVAARRVQGELFEGSARS